MIRHLTLPRRSWALILSVLLAVAGLIIVSAQPAAAGPATTRAFTPVYTANVTGDVTIRGNTLETCLAGSVQAQGTITCAATQAGASQQNNNYFMDYVDADGTTGNTTFDSSSATVTVPAGATVLYAGLSWGATTGAGSLANYPALTGVAAPNASLKNKAKFKVPGASDYSVVTANSPDVNGVSYQSFVDVTTQVKAAGSGTYSVADVQAGTGGGNYAGWSLAVAFSDPTMPARNLVIFTGYNQVTSGTPTVDIPVSGFTTPAVGAVSTKVGVVAYEGDKGSVGDGMSIGSTALYNTLNPINDVFNSSLTDLNVAVTDRTPNYANLLGFDIDRLDATGALANGSTSTTVHLTTNSTNGETYYPGMLTFATDLYSSALTATKTVTDVNGGNVLRNDRLNYSVTVTNGGGDGAAATILTDAVPAGTTYVASSLTIGGAAASDATGDDTGDVTAGNVTARLGVGATSTAGGVLIPAAAVTVAFAVTVNPTVTDGAAAANTALFTNTDQTTGVSYSGGSNTVTSNVVVPPTLGGTMAAGEVTAPYSSGFTVSNGTGPYVWSLSAGTLPAGLTLNASTGLITGTPTTVGSSSVTVQVTDSNSRTAIRTQSIVVAAGPTVTFTPSSGEIGVAYTAQPTVTGGTGPYTWSVSAGILPAGLSINTTTGAISGTPTATGTPNITVQATDANGGTSTQARTLTIAAAPTLSGSLAAAELTAPYSSGFTVNNGIGPFVWSISTGTLPAGLTLNISTGRITGTPTAGSSTITVQVTDANGLSTTRSGPINVGDGPVVTFTAPAGEIGISYTAQPTATGGTGPYTWAVSSGTLPAGLTIDPTSGAITGTPTAAGTPSITVQVTDANGGTATQASTLTIVTVPALTFAASLSGQTYVAYSKSLSFTGGLGPFVWSVSAGALPDGLSLDPGTGLLSGTPTTVGSSSFTVRLVDKNGIADTRAVTMDVTAVSSNVSLSAPASVGFGTTVTLTATVGPNSPTGTVTFTDVPATGPHAGTTVTLGSATLSADTAGVTVTLPAFGVNQLKASYSGDATHSIKISSAQAVEVSGFAGEVIVTEFRTSGPAGAGDSYVELLNTGPTVPLAGLKVTTSTGSVSTLPDNAGPLGTGRSYLLTGSDFSLGAIATSDFSTTLGSGGVSVTTPDTAGTQTDAVGPASGFHLGTGLPTLNGTPTGQYAWVRTEQAGAVVDSRDNAADFQLVSTTLDQVGGQQPTLGSPSPTGTADPYQHNSALQSTLLDPDKGASSIPNRVSVRGTPGRLTVRRTITNTSDQTISTAQVRVSALSEQYGAPRPGILPQPANVARLRAVDPAAPTEAITLSGGTTVTVRNLSVDAPNHGGLGGGLNSTFTVPLPNGGLAPNASVNVAFTFAVDARGSFWFAYDVDATTTNSSSSARRALRSTTHTGGRASARRTTTRHTAATDTGRLR